MDFCSFLSGDLLEKCHLECWRGWRVAHDKNVRTRAGRLEVVLCWYAKEFSGCPHVSLALEGGCWPMKELHLSIPEAYSDVLVGIVDHAGWTVELSKSLVKAFNALCKVKDSCLDVSLSIECPCCTSGDWRRAGCVAPTQVGSKESPILGNIHPEVVKSSQLEEWAFGGGNAQPEEENLNSGNTQSEVENLNSENTQLEEVLDQRRARPKEEDTQPERARPWRKVFDPGKPQPGRAQPGVGALPRESSTWGGRPSTQGELDLGRYALPRKARPGEEGPRLKETSTWGDQLTESNRQVACNLVRLDKTWPQRTWVSGGARIEAGAQPSTPKSAFHSSKIMNSEQNELKEKKMGERVLIGIPTIANLVGITDDGDGVLVIEDARDVQDALSVWCLPLCSKKFLTFRNIHHEVADPRPGEEVLDLGRARPWEEGGGSRPRNGSTGRKFLDQGSRRPGEEVLDLEIRLLNLGRGRPLEVLDLETTRPGEEVPHPGERSTGEGGSSRPTRLDLGRGSSTKERSILDSGNTPPDEGNLSSGNTQPEEVPSKEDLDLGRLILDSGNTQPEDENLNSGNTQPHEVYNPGRARPGRLILDSGNTQLEEEET
ncbi:hypothetical protein FNV43_RR09701 [Rhamnella rubrinervis]|uniref:Uncharacterized protein n=1 Tax=Rhamnella rubrinervis TaxID=2594499 RepID=A0A8K0HAJ2_9ROSA|nr:hypothetical protein FNV43_RR09701 [Rhamnella rubrinervis]